MSHGLFTLLFTREQPDLLSTALSAAELLLFQNWIKVLGLPFAQWKAAALVTAFSGVLLTAPVCSLECATGLCALKTVRDGQAQRVKSKLLWSSGRNGSK